VKIWKISQVEEGADNRVTFGTSGDHCCEGKRPIEQGARGRQQEEKGEHQSLAAQLRRRSAGPQKRPSSLNQDEWFVAMIQLTPELQTQFCTISPEENFFVMYSEEEKPSGRGIEMRNRIWQPFCTKHRRPKTIAEASKSEMTVSWMEKLTPTPEKSLGHSNQQSQDRKFQFQRFWFGRMKKIMRETPIHRASPLTIFLWLTSREIL
jgi:hypothetical protein